MSDSDNDTNKSGSEYRAVDYNEYTSEFSLKPFSQSGDNKSEVIVRGISFSFYDSFHYGSHHLNCYDVKCYASFEDATPISLKIIDTSDTMNGFGDNKETATIRLMGSPYVAVLSSKLKSQIPVDENDAGNDDENTETESSLQEAPEKLRPVPKDDQEIECCEYYFGNDEETTKRIDFSSFARIVIDQVSGSSGFGSILKTEQDVLELIACIRGSYRPDQRVQALFPHDAKLFLCRDQFGDGVFHDGFAPEVPVKRKMKFLYS